MSKKCPRCGAAGEVKTVVPVFVNSGLSSTSCGTEPRPDLISYECGSETRINHGHTESIGCLRRQLAQQARELEQSRQSEAQALAVLARVRKWADSKYTIDNRKSIEAVKSNIETVINSLAELDTMLTDTPGVLAVVDGYRVDGPHPFNDPWFEDEPDEIQLNVWRDKPALGRSYTSVRVIVLSRDEKEK